MTKAQLQTIADLVAIAHDEYDGCPSYRDDLERYDRVLAEIKAEAHSAPGNATAAPEAETLAAIIAEMRAARNAASDTTLVPTEWLTQWADRIEAAAARERDEDRRLAAIAESDEAFARCARCDRPERAPGNVAALREALRQISLALWGQIDPGCNNDCCAPKRELARLADAALAAPARNCDLYPDCNAAWKAYNAIEDRERLPGFDFWLFEEAKQEGAAR
jgi:hypothetical protein